MKLDLVVECDNSSHPNETAIMNPIRPTLNKVACGWMIYECPRCKVQISVIASIRQGAIV